MYKTESANEMGTLSYFRNKLGHTQVNGSVKSNYKAHEQLVLLVGEFYLVEQALEFFNMPTHDSWPSGVPRDVENLPLDQQQEIANNLLLGMLRHYQYLQFNLDGHVESNINPPRELVRDVYVLSRRQDGALIARPSKWAPPPDAVMSYGSQVCAWSLQLMNLNDMAKEGDINRIGLSVKANMPFFFSHSNLSKYYVECLDIILKTQHMNSPQMQMRLLESSFVNTKGGAGNNMEVSLLKF